VALLGERERKRDRERKSERESLIRNYSITGTDGERERSLLTIIT
jgi:hypothetical protein